MSLTHWVGLGMLVVIAGIVAWRMRGTNGRRPVDRLPALPDGMLDLGALPVPYAGRRLAGRMLQAFLDVTPSPFASAVRGVRTRLVLEAGEGGRGVVLVMPWCEPAASTERHASCGQSCAWVASNLALALGQLGPVLLVNIAAGPSLLDGGDAATDEDGTSRPSGEPREPGPRYWRPGMIDVQVLGSQADLYTDLVAGWRARFEWVLIDANGAPGIDALVAALPADAIHAYVVDAKARAAMGVSGVPATHARSRAVITIDDA